MTHFVDESTADLAVRDFFSDPAVLQDPYAYYEAVRARGPVWEEPNRGCFMVTGYEEICHVYRDVETFSSINGIDGPFTGLDDEPHDPDDVSDLIEKYRDRIANKENFISYEGDRHAAYRSLMMRMLTPKRIQESETFIRLATDAQIDAILRNGACEFVDEFARPLAARVIVNLLGVPESDTERLMDLMAANGLAGALGQAPKANHHGVLEASFISYIERRRGEPRADVLTQMAQMKFPDGRTPKPIDVARVAEQLFAGGYTTITRFSTTVVRQLAEEPELQARLRIEPQLISNLVDEMLRLASPAKQNYRMARVSTSLAGVRIPAGKTLVLLLPAGNRDPRRFECSSQLDICRSNSREHVSFGRGPHSCPGGPLTRTEIRIVTERLLDRLGEIEISEQHHGPPSDRRYEVIPSYILHGVQALHLKFTGR